MTKTKISQIGATDEGRNYLRLLAGKSDESGAKADKKMSGVSLFEEMKDAYRLMFIYGLIKGKREPTKKSFNTIYAQLSMLSDPHDYSSIIRAIGKPEDLDDVGKSINEYTNWAIIDVKKRFPKGNISAKDFQKLFD